MGLIITRRTGEAIRVGHALVTVVRLRNGRVKLRVDAPREVPIEAVKGPVVADAAGFNLQSRGGPLAPADAGSVGHADPAA